MSEKNGVHRAATTLDPDQDITITVATDRPVDEHAREVAAVNDRGDRLRGQKAYVQSRLRTLVDELRADADAMVIADALSNAGEILRVEVEKALRAARKKGMRK